MATEHCLDKGFRIRRDRESDDSSDVSGLEDELHAIRIRSVRDSGRKLIRHTATDHDITAITFTVHVRDLAFLINDLNIRLHTTISPFDEQCGFCHGFGRFARFETLAVLYQIG